MPSAPKEDDANTPQKHGWELFLLGCSQVGRIIKYNKPIDNIYNCQVVQCLLCALPADVEGTLSLAALWSSGNANESAPPTSRTCHLALDDAANESRKQQFCHSPRSPFCLSMQNKNIYQGSAMILLSLAMICHRFYKQKNFTMLCS